MRKTCGVDRARVIFAWLVYFFAMSLLSEILTQSTQEQIRNIFTVNKVSFH